MSNYTKTTDFEAKDSLPTGDSGKIIRGAEFETEFDAISTAIATKADTAGPTFTGTLTFETISDGTIGVTAFVDEDDMSSDSATLVPTQQSVKAYVDSVTTELNAQDLDFQADSGGALNIDLDTETMTFTGGTGIDTSGSGNTVTFDIDSTVTTLTGTQTLTNKTLTAPVISGNLTTDGTIDGRDVATDGAKLDGIEAGATTDQTDAEIRAAVEAATDSNVFTDADHTKLDGIEASATADQTDAEIRAAVEAATDSNVFTDADHTKLDGIEANATADQTDAEIRAAVEAATDSNVFTDADHTKLDGIEALADVTDTTNVTAAGALMDSELTNLTAVKSLDQGVATTDTPTFAGLATSADVTFGDNDKAIFGAGSDLQIYHNGSKSIIHDVTAGNLEILAADFVIKDSTAVNTLFYADAPNGAVSLYHSNAAKLATTSTGIDVTGTVVSDGVQSTDGDIKVTTSGSFVGFNSQRAGVPSSGGYQLGRLNFDAYSTGTTFVSGASIQSFSDGAAWTSSSTPAYLSLQTTPSGSTSLKERLKIANNGDISFYEDTGTTAKLFWDASAESLGIGTSSPDSALVVQGGQGTYAQIKDGTVTTLLQARGQDSIGVVGTLSNHGFGFFTNSTERMRIDSSGNLLVGTTDTTLYNNTTGGGFKAGGDDRVDMAREADIVAMMNRTGNSDGTILQFRKDGSTVGSIGVDNSDNLFISGGSGHGGVEFGTNALIPSSNGVAADATVKLGNANYRYTDLYLSGGVYLGGTGSANLLDDYEEGTFTPTWTPASGSGQTISAASGHYTKVGNRVFVDIYLATNGHGTASGDLTLGGLPFTQTTNAGQNASLSCGQAANAGLVAGQAGAARINQSATTITPLVWDTATGTTTMTVSQWGVSGTWRFTGSYQV